MGTHCWGTRIGWGRFTFYLPLRGDIEGTGWGGTLQCSGQNLVPCRLCSLVCKIMAHAEAEKTKC